MKPPPLTLRIEPDHPALAGHFPGSPIVPGVVLLDEALHAIEQTLPPASRSQPWQIGSVKFHHIARPGETLRLQFDPQPDGTVRFAWHCLQVLIASGTAAQRRRAEAPTP
jgi:3-hydroxyacyl-[acyl-carrier-protein] dehydratase